MARSKWEDVSKFHLITGVGVSCPSLTVTDPGDRQLQPGAELAASQHQSLAGAADRRSWSALYRHQVGVSEAGEVRSFPAMKGCFLKKKSRRGLSVELKALPPRPDLSTWPHSPQQQ